MGIKEKLYNKSMKMSRKIDIDGKTIYIKKTGYIVKDWQKINPPVEEIDGKLKWNYFNLIFGGKKNLIRLMLIFLLLSFAYYELSGLLGNAKEWMDGNKYIIMKREAFETFCSRNIIGSNYSDYGIITNITNWSLYG